ncbi:MAG TPA: SRPBCC family protein [Ardenticatenaceae bacterium]|nr:SRPBCC family protein [Ardenticatenaceae bacterium]
MRISASVTVDRCTAAVFDFLTTWEKLPLWETGVLEAARSSPGPPGVGERGRDVRRYFGRTFETEYEVTEYDSPRATAVHSVNGALPPVRATYTLTPVSGGTRLESVANFDVHGPMRLLVPLLGPMFQYQHARDLRRLKELLESSG